MATFYNRQGDKVTLTIEGFTDYDITAVKINSCDISQNIFCNIYTSALSVSLLTSNKAIYTGSLIGKSVTLKIENDDSEETRYYTIVTNVADMDANYHSEVIEIEAIDNLTIYKNQRYEVHGFKTVADILVDILGSCVILSAWGGTDIKDIKINIDALYEDEGETAPLKYDVLQVLCEYCNRSLYYNYKEGLYVFFAVNSHNKVGVYVSEDSSAAIQLDYHDTQYTINANTIAQTDRRISLEDPWQSAELTSKFEDADVREETVTYTDDVDEGQMSCYDNKQAKYVAYWATTNGSRHYRNYSTDLSPTPIATMESQTIAKTKQEAEAVAGATDFYYFGGRKLSIAAGLCDDSGDVEGTIDTEENIMAWCNVQNHMYGIIPIYTMKVETAQVVTRDLYLILGGDVMFSRYPFPLDEGEKTYTTNTSWCRKFVIRLYHTDGTSKEVTVLAKLVKDDTQVVRLGNKYSIQNNVYWRHHVDSTGTLVELCYPNYQSNEGKILSKIEIDVYMSIHDTGATTYAMLTPYEFINVKASFAHSTSQDAQFYGTDTIYKWVNDDENAVVCSGNEYTQTLKIVTYDHKMAGNNCAIDATGYLAEMSDEMHYDGNSCISENRRVNDLGAQYATNTFTESVTVKGLLWFDQIIKDNYYNRNAVATNLVLDVVNATTNITIKEVKQWQ